MEQDSAVQRQRIVILFPRAEEFEAIAKANQRERISDVKGKRFLLLDDMRPNANVLLAALRDILVRDYAVQASVADVRSLGGDHTDPLPNGTHERLAADCDAVIVALAS